MSNLSSQLDCEKPREHRDGIKKILKRTGHADNSNNVNTHNFLIKQSRLINKAPKKSAVPELKVNTIVGESKFVLTKRNHAVILDQKDLDRRRSGEAPQKLALDVGQPLDNNVDGCCVISS
jgi:hypothetical protein